MLNKLKQIKLNTLEALCIEMAYLSDNWCFRGQAHDWPIKSSIDRFLDTIRDKNPILKNENQNVFLEMKILTQFFCNNEKILKMHGIEEQNEENFILLQVLQQHYGYPTRLTDWTKNWKIALFFCIEDNTQSEEMVLWAINMKNIHKVEDVICDDKYLFPTILFEDNKIHSYYNRLRDGIYLIDVPVFERIKAQEGLLLASGHADDMIFEKHIFSSSWINNRCVKKYIISKTLRNDIEVFLEQNDINKEKLYPKEFLEMTTSDKKDLTSFANELYPLVYSNLSEQ